MKKKLLSLALTGTMALSMVSIPSFAANYQDTEDHWAKAQIEKWSDFGVIQGSDGKFRPNEDITRGDLAVIIDRLMKYPSSSENTFTDLESTYYTDAVLKANKAGVVLGSEGKVRPNDKITREEAIVMLGRAFGYTDPGNADFDDNEEISSWAKGFVGKMKEKKYISGRGGNYFVPKGNITRAEVVTILDNMIKQIYSDGADLSEDQEGMILINGGEVNLHDMAINGDLVVAPGVGQKDVTLQNVNVSGQTVIMGGSKAKVVGSFPTLRVAGEGVTVTLGGSKVDKAQLGGINSSLVVDIASAIPKVEIDSASQLASLSVFGTVTELSLQGASSSVAVNGTVSNITVEPTATSNIITAERGGTINAIEVKGTKTSINGLGSVKSTKIVGDNTTIDTVGTSVTVAANTTGTKVKGRDVNGGASGVVAVGGGLTNTIINGGSNGGSSGGNSGGTSSSTSGWEIELTPSSATLYTEGDKTELELDWKATPSAASKKSVTFKSSNTKVATVNSKGVVEAQGAGTATITATISGTSIKDTCKITVKDKASEEITGSEAKRFVLPTTFGYYADSLDEAYRVDFQLQNITKTKYERINSIKVILFDEDDDEITRMETVSGGVERLMNADLDDGKLDGIVRCEFYERSKEETGRTWKYAAYKSFEEPAWAEIQVVYETSSTETTYIVKQTGKLNPPTPNGTVIKGDSAESHVSINKVSYHENAGSKESYDMTISLEGDVTEDTYNNIRALKFYLYNGDDIIASKEATTKGIQALRDADEDLKGVINCSFVELEDEDEDVNWISSAYDFTAPTKAVVVLEIKPSSKTTTYIVSTEKGIVTKPETGEETITGDDAKKFVNPTAFTYVQEEDTEAYRVGFTLVSATEESYGKIKSVGVKLFDEKGKEIASKVTVVGGVSKLMEADKADGTLDGELTCDFTKLAKETADSIWHSSVYDFTKPAKAEITVVSGDDKKITTYIVTNDTLENDEPENETVQGDAAKEFVTPTGFFFEKEADKEWYQVNFTLMNASDETYDSIASIKVELYKEDSIVATKSTVDGGVAKLLEADKADGGQDGKLSCEFTKQPEENADSIWNGSEYSFEEPTKAVITIVSKTGNKVITYIVETDNLVIPEEA